ncbi:tryptamine hydroxycinnamoyltransferase 1-like [Tasmannia lanceolata]|uniref:tryptamine hydroxycinnamoyltransferase 1-like n=1 Tax=Tasmannia lanceolata TaxID=3420 RepID=UPI004064A85E
MEVQVLRSTIISNVDQQTKVTQIPLTIFDRSTLNWHIPVIYAFTPPAATNTALKEGLIKTLAHFPTLVGRFGETDDNGLPCILFGRGKSRGALFVEAKVDENLENYLPLEPSLDMKSFYPPTEEAKTLIQVQLNRFACGGLVIAITAHHWVADGQSMGNFFTAWGRCVRGLDVAPLPVYDQSMLAPRHPPRCEFEFWGVEFAPLSLISHSYDEAPLEFNPDIRNILVHYSKEFISTKLKGQLLHKYSTFELLLAHLWRKITVARGLDPMELTQIRVAVNGRQRLSPPAPKEYFGNLVINAFSNAIVQELLDGSLEHTAGLVRGGVRQITDSYLRSFIDFGFLNEREVLMPITDIEGTVLSPNLEVDCWLGFNFDEMNFGCGGRLCSFLPGWVPVEGVVILIPSLDEDVKGGVDVIVTMLEEHAKLFKQISHSLA